MRSDSASTSSCSSASPNTSTAPRHRPSLPSPPSTPARQLLPVDAHPSVGLLTPVSSKASLSPAFIDGRRQPSTASVSNTPQHRRFYAHHQRSASAVVHSLSGSPSIRRASLRRTVWPSSCPRPPLLVLEVQQPRPALPTAADALMSGVSRASSPQGRQRALSPTRPSISRPPSRCESLLRDTLRKDDFERQSFRSESSAGVPVPKSRRSRGRSVLGSRSTNHTNNNYLAHPYADETSGVELFDEAGMFSANGRGSMDFLYRSPVPASNGHARLARGLPIGSPPEVPHHYLPYGSPASPTPLPPTMLRTRTAPAVPRSSSKVTGALALDGVHDGSSSSTRPPHSPARHTVPNMAGASTSSMNSAPAGPIAGSSASSDSSPKMRVHSLSPHEAVLRAKLESVLRAGSTSPEEWDSHNPTSAGRSRHHQRAHTHGVAFQATQDDPVSISPQSFTTYSLSNSASDFAGHACATPSHRRNSNGNASTTSSGGGSGSDRAAHSSTAHADAPHPHPQHRSSNEGSYSPASPDELLTPPSTPPFNAWTASEMCKRMDGYVSFANVEGLGEPPGLDIDGDAVEGAEGLRKWGKWFKRLPFVHASEGHPVPTPAGHGHSHSSSLSTGQVDARAY